MKIQIEIYKYNYTITQIQGHKYENTKPNISDVSSGGGSLSPSVQLPATSMSVHSPQQIQKKTLHHFRQRGFFCEIKNHHIWKPKTSDIHTKVILIHARMSKVLPPGMKKPSCNGGGSWCPRVELGAGRRRLTCSKIGSQSGRIARGSHCCGRCLQSFQCEWQQWQWEWQQWNIGDNLRKEVKRWQKP